MKQDLNAVFDELRKMFSPYAGRLDCKIDADGDYYLDTSHVMKNGKPLFFGAVKILKSSVAYHLMPVYVETSLLDAASPALKKRMRGKSCFHFTATDAVLFEELRDLTKAGFEAYRKLGYVA